MKILSLIILLLLIAFPANATSTITPNVPADGSALTSSVVRNNFNAAITDINALQAKFPVPVTSGGTSSITSQGALNSLYKAPIGTAAPIVVPCAGGGDESNFGSAQTSAATQRTSMLVGNGCQLNNQWILPGASYTSVYQLGGGPVVNDEMNSSVPLILFNASGISANAPGQAAIDIRGPRSASFNGVNLKGDDSTLPMALISSGAQNNCGSACNVLDIFNSSLGGANTGIGCPVDFGGNCLVAGGVAKGTIAGGSGYTNGTYNSVTVTGGSGTGAVGTVVVSGGAVIILVFNNAGSSYVVGNVLTVNAALIGGTGSGFTYTVTSIGKNTYSSFNILARVMKTQFSNMSGCALCANFSDLQFFGNEISGTDFGIKSTAGGANQIANNRIEFHDRGITFNSNGNFGGYINSNYFNNNQGDYDISLGIGGAYIVDSNQFDAHNARDVTPSLVVGGSGSINGVTITGNMWNAGTNIPSCIQLKSGFSMDYISMTGNVCFGNSITKTVDYQQVPAHFVEDSIGPHGQHAEMGRPFGIGTSAPNPTATFNVHGNVAIGTANARITPPTDGLLVSGNVGIGTSNPAAPLQVGSAVSVGTQLILQNSSGACSHNPGASSETVTCSSDAALKSDIVDSPSALAWLNDIKIRDFTVNATGERMQGVVAQEMLPTHSDMVHIAPNGLYAVDEPNPWVIVKAIQEQQDQLNLIYAILGGVPIAGAGALAAKKKLDQKKSNDNTETGKAAA